jgi:hypothetical protein
MRAILNLLISGFFGLVALELALSGRRPLGCLVLLAWLVGMANAMAWR